MSVTIKERFNSRPRTVDKNGAVELRYWAKGSDDDQVITDLALDTLPEDYIDLPRQRVRVEPLGAGIWDIVGEYAPNNRTNVERREPEPPPKVGDVKISFDTTGGTKHITHSKETVQTVPAAGYTDVPDFHGGINVTDDGVEGVDVVVPQCTYAEEHQIAAATVTLAYLNTLVGLTGKTNNATWRGFAAGELLFMGAKVDGRLGEDFYTVTFSFSASPNVTGLEIGGAIDGIAKDGHEYVWVATERVEDATAGKLILRPLAAYVERVYDAGDFSALGIGT